MRNRVLLACLLSTFSLAMQAQDMQDDYHPMAVEGRMWDIQVGGVKENVYFNGNFAASFNASSQNCRDSLMMLSCSFSTMMAL